MIHTVTKLSAGDFPLNTLIHPTAVIHPSAKLDPKVKVGPYAVIGANVEIEADTIIDAHVVIEGPTKIGKGNHIFSGAVIGNEPQDLKYSWIVLFVDTAIYVLLDRDGSDCFNAFTRSRDKN